MSDHVAREFHALLRSARNDATATTRNRLRRLRTLDAEQVVPGAEIDRIEFILTAREMRIAEARGFAMGLMANHGLSASVLASDLGAVPERQHPALVELVEWLASNPLARKRWYDGFPWIKGAHVGIGIGVAAILGLATLAGWMIFEREFGEDDVAEVAVVEESPSTEEAVDEESTDGSDRRALPGSSAEAGIVDGIARSVAAVESLVVRVEVEGLYAWSPAWLEQAGYPEAVAQGGLTWEPLWHGTAFPVAPGLFLTNRHVAHFDRADFLAGLDRGGYPEDHWKRGVQGHRLTLIGRFEPGGPLREIRGKMVFYDEDSNDDIAVIEADVENFGVCVLGPPPPKMTTIYTLGHPGVAASLAGSFAVGENPEEAIARDGFSNLRENDGSFDLVKKYGVFKLEPTVAKGAITKSFVTAGILQHDAVMSGGNSGGPLVDEDGRVVGVNTWGANDDTFGAVAAGYNFSVRADRVREILGHLKLIDEMTFEGFDDD